MTLSRAQIEIWKFKSPEGKKTRVLVGRIGGGEVSEVSVYQRGNVIRAVQNTINGHQEIKTYGYPEGENYQPDRKTLIGRLREMADLTVDLRHPIQTNVEGLNLRNKSDQQMYNLLKDASQRSARIQQADRIIEGLPPLEFHQTGPGNKYETRAYAERVGISVEAARRELVLLPNSERMVKPNRS